MTLGYTEGFQMTFFRLTFYMSFDEELETQDYTQGVQAFSS